MATVNITIANHDPFPCPIGWSVDLAESRIRSGNGLINGYLVRVVRSERIPMAPNELIQSGGVYAFVNFRVAGQLERVNFGDSKGEKVSQGTDNVNSFMQKVVDLETSHPSEPHGSSRSSYHQTRDELSNRFREGFNENIATFKRGEEIVYTSTEEDYEWGLKMLEKMKSVPAGTKMEDLDKEMQVMFAMKDAFMKEVASSIRQIISSSDENANTTRQ